jgi:hypothetical protein
LNARRDSLVSRSVRQSDRKIPTIPSSCLHSPNDQVSSILVRSLENCVKCRPLLGDPVLSVRLLPISSRQKHPQKSTKHCRCEGGRAPEREGRKAPGAAQVYNSLQSPEREKEEGGAGEEADGRVANRTSRKLRSRPLSETKLPIRHCSPL